jgi:putative oxidoreductase
MEVVELLGRIVFAFMFVMSGVKHFRQREGMVAYSRAMEAPAPEVGVPLTGAMILAGGLLIALGLWADLGALLIFAFLVPTAYFMHGYWRLEDPQQRQGQKIHFEKNLSLAGAALLVFFLFNQFGPEIGLTIGDGRLFPEL